MNDEREHGADVAPVAPYIHHLLLLSKLARTGTGSEGAVKHADHAGVFVGVVHMMGLSLLLREGS
jgi:hypothetical protein